MGEGLIDFVPAEPGKVICNVDSFLPAVGGAPCNVCAAFAKLGGESAEVYTRTKKAAVPGIRVKAVDTTGAGDGFIGAFLFGLWREVLFCFCKPFLQYQRDEKGRNPFVSVLRGSGIGKQIKSLTNNRKLHTL